MTIQEIRDELARRGGNEDIVEVIDLWRDFDRIEDPWIRAAYYASYNTTQGYYHQGLISQAAWEAYCYVWQNTAFRYSSMCDSYDLKRGA